MEEAKNAPAPEKDNKCHKNTDLLFCVKDTKEKKRILLITAYLKNISKTVVPVNLYGNSYAITSKGEKDNSSFGNIEFDLEPNDVREIVVDFEFNSNVERETFDLILDIHKPDVRFLLFGLTSN